MPEIPIPEAWREPFELAWESFQAGSPAVGAVVVDASGVVLSRGRSRRHELVGPLGHLAGSRMAHAELNALAGLRDEDHQSRILYTTLQSCFLCAAAAAMSRVGTVRYAGADPVWDCLDGIPDLDPVLRDRWPQMVGPLGGLLGAWASVLALLDLVARNPHGDAARSFDRQTPAVAAVARGLVADGFVGDLRRLSLDAAMGAFADRLAPAAVPD